MGEGEPKVPESEVKEKQEQVPEEKEQEYSLSPEDREVVMKKFEELFDEEEEKSIRFVYGKQFEKYLQENRIEGEVASFGSLKFVLERIEEEKGGRGLGAFWSRQAADTTGWYYYAPGYPLDMGGIIESVARASREKAGELKKQGDKDWRAKAQKKGVEKAFEEIAHTLPGDARNALVEKFIDYLEHKEEFKDSTWFKREERDFREGLERASIREENGEIAQFILELMEKEDPKDYLAKNPEAFRRFLRFSYTYTSMKEVLPYQFMLILKKTKTGFRDTSKVFGWGFIDEKLDESLLAAVAMVPERTFVQESMAKLDEFCKKGKKQALIPFFDPRLNPRWPQDREVLEKMREKINEIRESVKEEQTKEDKNG